jgi:hypothetical protein
MGGYFVATGSRPIRHRRTSRRSAASSPQRRRTRFPLYAGRASTGPGERRAIPLRRSIWPTAPNRWGSALARIAGSRRSTGNRSAPRRTSSDQTTATSATAVSWRRRSASCGTSRRFRSSSHVRLETPGDRPRALAASGTPEALTAAGAIGEAMTRPGLRRLVTRELARRPGAPCLQATTGAGEQDAAADVAARCR